MSDVTAERRAGIDWSIGEKATKPRMDLGYHMRASLYGTASNAFERSKKITSVVKLLFLSRAQS